MIHRIAIALMLPILVCGSCLTASAEFNPAGAAGDLVKQLNPVNIALGPLVDNAISSGNFSLAQRLEQLRAIVQEALYSLDQIAQKRILQVNSDAEGRINQIQTLVGHNLDLFKSITDHTINRIDDVTYGRIKQFGQTTGNLLAALPIPTSPLPDVPPNGFSLVKEPGDSTTLFITGAGLFKRGVKPHAYLLAGDEKGGWWTHAGREIIVSSASMGLVELTIPNDAFPSVGTIERTLQLKMRSGMFVGTEEPTFPVLLCAKLPQYLAQVTQTAMGQVWERETIPYPSPLGRPDGVYITDNGSHGEADVCAEDYGGWSVDPEVADNGLEVGSFGSDKDGSAVYKDRPRPGCYHLYAGRDGNQGGNAWVGGVFVHLRRLKSARCGGVRTFPPVNLMYGSMNKITTTPDDVKSQCVSTSAGASVTAQAQTHIALQDISGKTLDEANIEPRGSSSLLNGLATVDSDAAGLLTISLVSKCQKTMKTYPLQVAIGN